MYEEKMYYIDNKPPCKVIKSNEPNLELMAKAFRNLYYKIKEREQLESVKN
jgi:hypothetical protein